MEVNERGGPKRERNEKRGGEGRREGKSVQVARNSPDVGSVLSFALRLRKRKSGVSHTQIAKNVAISPNAGGFTTGPPRYA
jgi:hypothetical protein